MTPDRVSFGYREDTPGEKKRRVREQFDPIAATYDRSDAVLSAGLDERWRKKGIGLLRLRKGDRVLDLCGGTGDFAFLAAARTGAPGRVVIYDFNRGVSIGAGVSVAGAAGAEVSLSFLFIPGYAHRRPDRLRDGRAVSLPGGVHPRFPPAGGRGGADRPGGG